MKDKLSTKILRILSFVVGIFMFGISAFMSFIEGNFELWVGLVLGPIFVLYGVLGKSKFAKLLPGASRDI